MSTKKAGKAKPPQLQTGHYVELARRQLVGRIDAGTRLRAAIGIAGLLVGASHGRRERRHLLLGAAKLFLGARLVLLAGPRARGLEIVLRPPRGLPPA